MRLLRSTDPDEHKNTDRDALDEDQVRHSVRIVETKSNSLLAASGHDYDQFLKFKIRFRISAFNLGD